MKSLKSIAALFLLALFLFMGCEGQEPKTEDTAAFSKLNWMRGIWEGEQGNAETYESWVRKSYRIMEGISFTKQNKEKVYSQSMRIEQNNNKIKLLLKAEGAATPDVFDLAEVTEDRAVFINTENKYPEKIIYEKSGDKTMIVKVAGENEAQSTTLKYEKTKEL